jgi:hypothetical protein
MKLIITLFLFALSTASFAGKVTIEVRSAYDGSLITDAELNIYYESIRISKSAKIDKNATFKFKIRTPVTITPRTKDDRYFGQALYLTRKNNGTKQVVYLYPTRKYDIRLLEEDGCTIKEKKTLSAIEKESEEIKLNDNEDTPQEDAVFPRGTQEMKLYLMNTIRYPQFSMDLGEEAKVYVEFIVEKDGDITCAQTVNKVPLHIMSESLRVIRSMPNWKAATHKGEVVRARCRIPINFELQ